MQGGEKAVSATYTVPINKLADCKAVLIVSATYTAPIHKLGRLLGRVNSSMGRLFYQCSLADVVDG